MERASADALRRLSDGHRALYALLVLFSDARRCALAAGGELPPYGGKKTRMEIRVQDYSYNNGARERPVIEVTAQDIRTSDMLTLTQKLSGSSQLFERMTRSDSGSWWQRPVVDDLTVGDVVLLMSFAVAAFLALRLAVLALKLVWSVMMYPLRFAAASPRLKTHPTRRSSESSTREKLPADRAARVERAKGPPADLSASLQACHSQLLRVIHKLHREYREASAGDDTQDLVASLTLSHPQDNFERVTMDDVVHTLEEIQTKDPSLQSVKLDELPTQASIEAAAEQKDVRGTWERLQQLYVSFRSLQSSISRQHAYKRDARLRRRHQASFDDRDDEVLRVLSELTKELPQGFTSEMFASLGSAMRRAMVIAPPAPGADSNSIDGTIARRKRTAAATTVHAISHAVPAAV